ncbi:S41 family peptidase [Robiginitalea sp. IMCC44478]|uniref:S41 family peptidase n=1 Tax=Robiginitalea sp. IMCC44478 TaxID=3459122 RepID=UPI004043699F
MNTSYHLPKKALHLLFLLLFMISGVYSQSVFTSAQWQEDLRFLQKTVHQDYPFLFKKTTAETFDGAVEELYKSIPAMQDHEVLAGLMRLVASFKYGHTVLGYWEGKVDLHQLPLFLYQFDDGLYVEGIHSDFKEGLGGRVIAIEGMPIETVLKKMRPVVPAENEQFVKAYGLHYLTIPELLHAQGVTDELKMNIELTLEKDGQKVKQTIAAVPMARFPSNYGFVKPGGDWLSARDTTQTPLYLKNIDKIYFYEYLPEQQTVYVRHSQIQDEPSQDIPAFYTELFDFIENNPVEKLILDVRLNGGGNNYKNKPIVTGIIETEKINVPGKFFVIIGRRTFSACQNLVNELHNYTNAIFVGEPTGENINFYGDNRPVNLPNTGIKALLSFAWWQDKPQWENADWLAPQIDAGMTFEQYRTNQDPALQAALDFEGEGFIADPMTYFTNLFTSGQADRIMPEAQKMLADSRYSFFDFEAEFNSAGYKLLNSEQYQEAIFVFTMLTNLFPESANTWDSLAEGYWRAGDLEKARMFYNKAIELDPDGNIGKRARQMLKQLEEGK